MDQQGITLTAWMADTYASLSRMVVFALAHDTTNQLIAASAALGGAIVGGLITFFTALVQTRHARSERHEAAATARRNRAAEILGRVRTFLTDVEPARIGFNVDPETTPVELEGLASRLTTLRDELSVFAAGTDDDQVMAAASKLEVSLFSTFIKVRWHARDLLTHRDPLQSLKAAEREHLRTTTLVRIVLDLVRGRDVTELEAQLLLLDEKPVDD